MWSAPHGGHLPWPAARLDARSTATVPGPFPKEGESRTPGALQPSQVPTMERTGLGTRSACVSLAPARAARSPHRSRVYQYDYCTPLGEDVKLKKERGQQLGHIGRAIDGVNGILGIAVAGRWTTTVSRKGHIVGRKPSYP